MPISMRSVACRYIALGTMPSWKPRCSAVHTPSKPRSSAAFTTSTVPTNGPNPENARLSRKTAPPVSPVRPVVSRAVACPRPNARSFEP